MADVEVAAPATSGEALFSTRGGKRPPRDADDKVQPIVPQFGAAALATMESLKTFLRDICHDICYEVGRGGQIASVETYWDAYDIKVYGKDLLQQTLYSLAWENDRHMQHFTHDWAVHNKDKLHTLAQDLPWTSYFTDSDVDRHGATFLKIAHLSLMFEAQRPDNSLQPLLLEAQQPDDPLQPHQENGSIATDASQPESKLRGGHEEVRPALMLNATLNRADQWKQIIRDIPDMQAEVGVGQEHATDAKPVSQQVAPLSRTDTQEPGVDEAITTALGTCPQVPTIHEDVSIAHHSDADELITNPSEQTTPEADSKQRQVESPEQRSSEGNAHQQSEQRTPAVIPIAPFRHEAVCPKPRSTHFRQY